MRIDKFGQPIYSEEDIVDIYMKNHGAKFKYIFTDSNIDDITLELNSKPKIIKFKEQDISIQEFDTINQNNWFMPKEYLEMDIAKWVLDQCNGDAELQRAGDELLKFHERDMFNLLRYLKYLVDVMRENNVVWGVGRGSSVASFVLFLIGIHKVNSLYFDLPIEEFLK